MKIGIDYYPEHWDEDLWERDADMMAEAGVYAVRLGEFAWSLSEPKEDEFDFGWLDRAIDMFAARGIKIILCTPTACPPLWMYDKYPDLNQKSPDGSTVPIGIRGHRCINSESLIRRTRVYLERICTHYKDNSAIIAWQIDNELEGNFCRCERCTSAFTSYLKSKYQSLDELNKAYGTPVWNGIYSSWEQVKPPAYVHPKGWYNPSLSLDYHRYAQENVCNFSEMQAETIRKHFPHTPITTNTWFCDNHPDYDRLFEKLDIVAYDNYPAVELPEDKNALYSHAFHLDFMRGIKGKNFWIMEQLSGAMGSWMPMGRAVYPGQIKGYALQAFAHGADMVVHFRWRTAVQGAEMFWHGLIDHSNVPGRRYREFLSLCEEANTLGAITGGEIKSAVAVLYDSDSETALRIQPQTNGFDYLTQLKIWHDGCTSNGVNTDIIPSDRDFSGYKVVIAPALFVVKSGTAERLRDFVSKGGTLLLTARSAVKDGTNSCIMDVLPCTLSDICGAHVSEYCPIGWGQERITMDCEDFTITQWCDISECDTAETIAEYKDSYYKGCPAVTRNSFGKGTAYYVGTVPERAFCKKLMSRIFAENSITHEPSLPFGVEVTERIKGDTTYRFIFNNTMDKQEFTLYGKLYSMDAFEMTREKLGIINN